MNKQLVKFLEIILSTVESHQNIEAQQTKARLEERIFRLENLMKISD